MKVSIHVGNLNYNEVDESALFQLFSNYVDVFSVTLKRDADGKSRGYAFVELSDEDIERALESDGLLFHNRRIRVSVASNR